MCVLLMAMVLEDIRAFVFTVMPDNDIRDSIEVYNMEIVLSPCFLFFFLGHLIMLM